MARIFRPRWGEQKPKGSRATKRHFTDRSEMFVNVSLGEKFPSLIYIEIHGALAQIPSLKNNRQFGGIDLRTLAGLHAMDTMFSDSMIEQNIPHSRLRFGEQKVHIAMVVGGRSTANEDNAMTTIKDWLEPRTKIVGRKNKKARGWGIGLVSDDILVRGYALKAEDIGLSQNYTSISIRPWDDVQEEAVGFMAKCRQLEEAA